MDGEFGEKVEKDARQSDIWKVCTLHLVLLHDVEMSCMLMLRDVMAIFLNY